jgi:hypothetical protein
VLFYNLLTGVGRVRAADGKIYFIHFSNVETEKDEVFPVLTPMTAVSFRPGQNEKGESKAFEVREVAPAA